MSVANGHSVFKDWHSFALCWIIFRKFYWNVPFVLAIFYLSFIRPAVWCDASNHHTADFYLESKKFSYQKIERLRMLIPCALTYFCSVKPRRTRKEELQEAARQKVAAALAQSNTRSRMYGGHGTEGRKAIRTRQARATSLSKPISDTESGKTSAKPSVSAASNPLDGKCFMCFMIFFHLWFTPQVFLLPGSFFPLSSTPRNCS